MSPTRTEIPQLLSERNTAQNNVFLQVFSYTWVPVGTILVPHSYARRYRYPGEQTVLEEDIEMRRRFQGGLGTGPGFLVWMVAQFQGIPSWVNWYYQFPGNG